MSYNQQIYNDVARRYQEKHLAALIEADNRRAKVYAKVPRIEELDRQIVENASKVTRLALLGSVAPEAACEEIANVNKILQDEKITLLVTCGFDADYLSDPFECERCKDTGYIGGKMCRCFQNELSAAAYGASNMATFLDKQNFETFDISYYSDAVDPSCGRSPLEQMQEVLRRCIAFAVCFLGSDTQSLFMYGPPGLGKTFLSTAISKDLLDKGFSVFYQSASKIFSALADSKFRPGSENSDAVSFMYSCDLLIIDDLGTEFVNSYTVSAFFDILSSRITSGKKMIINSNLSLQEIEGLYSERISSRLLEFEILRFIGKDIRMIRSCI